MAPMATMTPRLAARFARHILPRIMARYYTGQMGLSLPTLLKDMAKFEKQWAKDSQVLTLLFNSENSWNARRKAHLRARLSSRMCSNVFGMAEKIRLEAGRASYDTYFPLPLKPEQQIRLVDVQKDVLLLTQEFPEVGVIHDKKDPYYQSLYAITHPITLEDVALGRFKILFWPLRLEKAQFPIRVQALEPKYHRIKRYWHPHVTEVGDVCLGDGGAACENAVKTGRIFDLFLLIRAILETYNHESPYAQLHDWTRLGYVCGACGERKTLPSEEDDEDDIPYCQNCGLSLCEPCTRVCAACTKGFCHNCSLICKHCGGASCKAHLGKHPKGVFCKLCAQTCPQCGIQTPKSLLLGTPPLCAACNSANERQALAQEIVASHD